MTGSVKEVGAGGGRDLAELNCHMRDEHLEVRGCVVGVGEEDVNEGNGGGPVVMAKLAAKLQQQQQTSVQWERFLPVRTLKVLLVESDDSTRQVVSALLRNCSYEVTAAANGLQGWKILEDLTNRIDLVLTEVVMPCLSGIGLLCKIMNHKTCKNIPVIMMSSNDSMGIVFKCLSKGAVDFLVKPIRKNELKNLWQHVWRRSLSSSGSVSDNGIQTQKSVKSKSGNDSDNNTGSNDDDDDDDNDDDDDDDDGNGSIGLDIRDGSDNGSGTQSPWKKRAVEVDSPQPTCPFDQLADSPDSTCAQVIHPKIVGVPTTPYRGLRGQKEVDDDSMGKDLEVGVPGNPDTQHGSGLTEKVSKKFISESVDNLPESSLKNENVHGPESNNVPDKPNTQVVDLIGTMAKSINLQLNNRDNEPPSEFSKELEDKDSSIDGLMELTSLQLSLKRLRSTSDGITATHDDGNTLRHSSFSAFSRYHTSAASMQVPAGHGGSCRPLDNSSEAVKTESSHTMKSNSNTAGLNLDSNGSRDNNDMGSTTKKNFTKQSKPAHSSAFHPLQPQNSTLRFTEDKIDDMKETTAIGQPRAIQHQVQVQYSHHHYHHHPHHVHRMQQLHVPPEQNDLSLKSLDLEASPYCGSSNVLAGVPEGNAANCSLHGSNLGSNTGSNVQIRSSTAVNTEGASVETAHGTGGSNRNGSSSGTEQNRFAQREAALNKFRQKRKERNFQKKVRYHSRKKLAEERPRVRGQFVRRTALHENMSREANS